MHGVTMKFIKVNVKEIVRELVDCINPAQGKER